MNKKNDGGAAFPTPAVLNFNGEEIESERPGMSLRAYASVEAMKAMVSQGMVLACFRKSPLNTAETVARDAAVFADALIEELERDQ